MQVPTVHFFYNLGFGAADVNSPMIAVSFQGIRTKAVAAVLLVAASAFLATGCGSTKIYTPEKTVEYNGTIYNVSEVKQLSTRVETVPGSGDVIDLKGYDSKQFEALVNARGPVAVRTVISMDDRDMVYEQKSLQKGRDLDRMQDDLNDAYKKLTRFMADAGKPQLKL
jgi:hypothetical protein